MAFPPLGLSVAVIDSPVLSLVGTYFQRRRFLATGVVFAGSSLGTLVFPPLFTVLVDTYAIRGAMLIVGGMWLNTLAIGALIRPLVREPRQEWQEVEGKDLAELKGLREVDSPTMPTTLPKPCPQVQTDHVPSNTSPEEILANGRTVDVSRESSVPQEQSSDLCYCQIKSESDDSNARAKPKWFQRRTKSAKRCSKCPDTKQSTCDVNNHNLNGYSSKDPEKAMLNPEPNKSKKETPHPDSSRLRHRLLAHVKDYIRFLRTPGLCGLVVVFTLASFAYFNQFFVLPPLANEIGLSKMEGAWLVSIANVVELFSRFYFCLLYMSYFYLISNISIT